MSLFDRFRTPTTLVSIQVRRSKPDDKSPIVVEIDGIKMLVDAGEWSRALAIGGAVIGTVFS